jgi:hypothetical protein
MKQQLRQCDGAVLSPEQEEAIRTRRDHCYESDHGPHLRLGVRMERDALFQPRRYFGTVALPASQFDDRGNRVVLPGGPNQFSAGSCIR